MVIATQNPIEMEGTYALPEAQRDRFMARVSMGYPVMAAEIAMLASHSRRSPLEDLRPVTDAEEIRQAIGVINQVHTADSILRYAVQLTTATRPSPDLNLGAPPRPSLPLRRAAQSYPCMSGRNSLSPHHTPPLPPPP